MEKTVKTRMKTTAKSKTAKVSTLGERLAEIQKEAAKENGYTTLTRGEINREVAKLRAGDLE